MKTIGEKIDYLLNNLKRSTSTYLNLLPDKIVEGKIIAYDNERIIIKLDEKDNYVLINNKYKYSICFTKKDIDF